MGRLLGHARRLAGDVRRDWNRPVERVVLDEFAHRAASEPRRRTGTILQAPYVITYADAMTAWPQWDDVFVHERLRVETAVGEPRILDCGANIGLASLYFARRYPRARITAFEPDPTLAELCRRNLAANGASRVELVEAALWREDGPVRFVQEGTDSGTIASLGARVDGPVLQVSGRRLRHWLEAPVDILKLDIEGAEFDVLDDSRDALSAVRCLILDLHEFDPSHRQTGRIFDLLSAAGFLFDLAHHAPLGWGGRVPSSPFRDAAPVWAMTVRAWRP